MRYSCTVYLTCILFRKYRVSKIAPFASNIGFLMMECEEAGPKVMTFLQERPVQLPKCEDLACDWQTFKDIYAVSKALKINVLVFISILFRVTLIAYLMSFVKTMENL